MALPDTPNQADIARLMRRSKAWISKVLKDQDHPTGKALRRCRVPGSPHTFDKRKLIAEGVITEDQLNVANIDYELLADMVADRVFTRWAKAMGGLAS